MLGRAVIVPLKMPTHSALQGGQPMTAEQQQAASEKAQEESQQRASTLHAIMEPAARERRAFPDGCIKPTIDSQLDTMNDSKRCFHKRRH